MKTLKFIPELTQKILAGEKTSTWRLFDDKNLQVGDRLIFINKGTGDEFGEAVIKTLKVKTLGTLTDEDGIGHERFASEEETNVRFCTIVGRTMRQASRQVWVLRGTQEREALLSRVSKSSDNGLRTY